MWAILMTALSACEQPAPKTDGVGLPMQHPGLSLPVAKLPEEAPKPARWLLLYEYVLARPGNMPAAANPTKIVSTKAISRRPPGYTRIMRVAQLGAPEGVVAINVLGAIRVENPEVWPGNWLNLDEMKPDANDDE